MSKDGYHTDLYHTMCGSSRAYESRCIEGDSAADHESGEEKDKAREG